MTRLAIRSEHMRGKDGCLISILPPSRRLDTSREGEVDIVDPPVRMRAVPKDPAVRASGLAAYDVAVLVRDEERALAYVLLGDGRPADVDADTLQRLRDYEQFQAPITRLDADGFEAAEIEERTVQWRVGDGHARWLFDSYNAACTFAELCEASGFVPTMASPPLAHVMVQQQCQQQQACAAGPGAVHNPPLSPLADLPARGWSDDEIFGVIGPLLDEVEEAAVASFDERLRDAAASAVSATKAWLDLHQREAAGEHIPYSTSFDARERLQDSHRAHADMQSIVAVGDVGGDRTLWSHPDGLAVYTDGDAEPFLILPRGLDRDTVRLVLRTYDRAYDVGKAHGRIEIQHGLRTLLGAAAV